MNILLLTYGSRGDVQPYVALGKGLRKAGHEVTLGTSERFREFIEGHGLNYGYMNDDLLSILDTRQGKALMEDTDNLFGIVKKSILMARQVTPMQKALLRESWDIARSIQPDLIIFHPKAGGAPHIAEKLGINCVLATPIPMLIPTREWRFVLFPDWKLGGWYNRQSYRIIHFLTNKVYSRYIRAFRQELDLPPLEKFDFLKDGKGKDIPVLHAHSEVVLPRPSDWPDHAQVSGYWFLEEGCNWTPPQALVDFLEVGPPPVYVGFGSMSGRNPERLAGIVIAALEKANLRGILATGWGGLMAEDLPETIFKLDQAPHDWLFPKMAAVVHHGGAGTTAAGLRAGKPTVIVPFFADQPFWGHRVHELGAGPKPIRYKKLGADVLAAALREATGNRAMIEKAATIGRKIRSEDGVTGAVAYINALDR